MLAHMQSTFWLQCLHFDFSRQPLRLYPSKSFTKIVIIYPVANEIFMMKVEEERSRED